MILQTPPMGWNTWNTFGQDMTEDTIHEIADCLVDSGLRDAGYVYLILDDTWHLKHRDKNGHLAADPAKFPSGIKALADYIHGKGLKLGIYSCVGTMTCTGHAGSYEHEFIDAATFAAWEVDYLKYDYCFKPDFEKGEYLYRRMGLALANCGRDIVFSACSWGTDDTREWVKTTGAHLWRSTYDVIDAWESVKEKAWEQFCPTEKQKGLPNVDFGDRGCFNDMDMLVVGMNGTGNVGLRGSSFTQYRTHFALWCLMGSPLLIGCDIRKLDKETLALLKSKELIAIDQDPACRQPFLLGGFQNWCPGVDKEHFCVARFLEGGDIAVGMFNLSDDPANLFFQLSEMGLSRICGKKLLMTDLFTGEETESAEGQFTCPVEKHNCRIFRCRLAEN